MNFETIEYLPSERLVTLRLNRPEHANGLNVQLASELAQAAEKVAADSSVKAVILSGNGRFFCTGGDIKAMREFGDDVAVGLKGIADDLHRALLIFANMDAPVIVAVNGTAAGAGFSLAVAGDLVIASDQAKFTLAYTKIGLSPDGGSTYILPRLIGLRRTQELMLNNPLLSARQALEWGLVNRVVASEALQQAAQQQAEMLVSGARGAQASVKSLLRQTWGHDFAAQMALESEAISANSETPDGREGVVAFLDKRTPEYS